MGIRNRVQTALAGALNDVDKLGDISRDFELEKATTQARTTGRGWRATIKHYEADGEAVQTTDLKFKVLQNEINETPEIDDVIHLDGREYVIYDVMSASSNATWTLYARG